jgi:hypothetical protein
MWGMGCSGTIRLVSMSGCTRFASGCRSMAGEQNDVLPGNRYQCGQTLMALSFAPFATSPYPPDDENFIAHTLSTDVIETQECEGLWFFLSHDPFGFERRTARTRSVVSCPHVVPTRTWQVVPGTLAGTARRPCGYCAARRR